MSYPKSWHVAKSSTLPRNLVPHGTGRWYSIKNHGNSADILIYGEIGWDIQAVTFVNDLAALDVATLNVRINSPGGEVFEGMGVYNALIRHPARKITHVDGYAASMASVIAQAGHEIRMTQGSRMMIHDASGLVMGNAAEMVRMAKLLDDISNDIAGIYSRRAGGTVASWRATMAQDTWYSAEEAVTAGLADSVTPDRADRDQEQIAARMKAGTATLADYGRLRQLQTAVPAAATANGKGQIQELYRYLESLQRGTP